MRPSGLFRLAVLALALALPLAGPAASAATVRIAAASNFAEPARALAAAFTDATGHDAVVSTGSTGLLFAQITRGAPFDVFLAADTDRPARLIENGLAEAGSLRTYAVGRLALWDLAAADAPSPLDRLNSGAYRRLALANPALAPYGAAAGQVLDRLPPDAAFAERQVYGENVGQAYAFVATGNADLGFVALSQIRAKGGRGRHDVIPAAWHDPVRQDAVLLTRAADRPEARAFLDFLASAEAGLIIAAHGYEVPA